CRRCQGEFEARICDREENDNCCPYCAGKKLLSGYNSLEGKYPELIESFSNNNTCEIGEVLYTSKAKWIWECQVCHGEYEDT
ncbi:zinc-ribbon domain-containing protein, partial [Streptococcus pneumoniae]